MDLKILEIIGLYFEMHHLEFHLSEICHKKDQYGKNFSKQKFYFEIEFSTSNFMIFDSPWSF